jgi:IclR family transcriptional regulator, KDG regulon repressor
LTDYTVGVLEDAILILNLLQGQATGLSLAQITEESGFVKNKVFRLLFTLEKHQLVERDNQGRFWLGLRFLEFGQQVQRQTSLLQASEPIMDWLVAETGETIFLGVVNGCDALCVAARESPQSVRLFAEVGRRAPLYSGGVPKVLCAHLAPAARATMLEDLLDDERASLEKTLAEVREAGYVVVADELDMGAHSVAAPIHNHTGEVIAAISIAGPSHRFTPDVIETYIKLVCTAGLQISQALGYVSEAPQLEALYD